MSRKDNFIKKWGKEEGLVKYESYLKKLSKTSKGRGSKKWFIEKYDEDEGNKRFNEHLKKLSNAGKNNSFNEYIKKYGKEEGTKKWKKACKNRKYGFSIKGLTEKYGKEEAIRRKKEHAKKSAITKNGLIEKYGEIEGKKKWNNYITSMRTEKKYIEKYGEDEGKKRWNDRCKKNGITRNKMVRLYGKEEGNKRYNDYIKKMQISMLNKLPESNNKNFISGWYKGEHFRSSYELSFLIYCYENDIKIQSAENSKYAVIYFDENNKERYYFPDFYLPETNEIIEIKPYSRLKETRIQLKLNTANEKYGSKFKVLTEEDLVLLNIKTILKKNLNIKWSKNTWKKISNME